MEQALQYYLLQAHKETEEKYQQIETSLNQQLEKGKTEIWNCHKRVLEESNGTNVVRETQSQSGSKPLKTRVPTTINIEIIGGHYSGNTYALVPKNRNPCWVGRSQGKKFKERGISLSKDLEISTSHGKFEIIGGSFYYTDAGSTNGSKVHGTQEIVPDTPFPLEDGIEFTLGQSVLKVSLS